MDVTGAATFDSTAAVTGALTVTGVINADGKVKFPAGTASAPSFYNGTDTDTGLYFSAANEISVATGGTQRVVVDSSGNVGIAITTPQTKFHSSGTTNGAQATFGISNSGLKISTFQKTDNDAGVTLDAQHSSNGTLRFATTGSERLRIDSSGRVGIGTSSPSQLLTVNGVARFENFIEFGGSISTPGTAASIYRPADNNLAFGTASAERMRLDSSGNLGIGTASPSGLLHISGNTCQMHFTDEDDSSSSRIYLSGSTFAIDADHGNSKAGTVLAFRTDNAERMRIDTSGNVGIGTNSPTSLGGNFREVIVSGASEGAGLQLQDTDGNVKAGLFTSDISSAAFVRTITNHPLVFRTNNTERLRIDSSGNVGVNTSSPTSYANSQATLVIEDDTNPAICWSDTGQTRDWWAVANGSNLSFNYADGGGSGSASNITNALSMTNSGNVGIGTTSPAQRLHVVSAASTYVQVQNTGNSVNAYYGVDTGGAWVGASTNHPLKLHTNNTERLRITSAGLVGIGVTSPTNTLHVVDSNGTDGSIDFGPTSNRGRLYASSSGIFLGSTTNHDVILRTNNTEQLRISNSGVVTVKKSSVGEIDALTSASTITPDFAASNNFSVTLGTNATLANPSNLTAGQSGVIAITQDSTGSRTLAYGSKFKFAGGTAPTLTTTASAVDILTYYVESTSRITAQVLLDVS